MTTVDLEKDPAERVNNALIEFTGAVGESIGDICSYSLTIGEAYVPFNPDEDEDCGEEDAACSQIWVRVTSVTALATNTFEGDCAIEWQLGLEVGVLRCFGIEEDGEAPSASDVLVAATQAMSDMQAMADAAMACEVWNSILLGAWSPEGPLGGQYGGAWTMTVTI